jgi:DNA helicase II / ATP-dependent DNA helicase PcrA
LSFINVLCNPEDSLSLFHLSTGEIYNLPSLSALKINNLARKVCGCVEDVYKKVINFEQESEFTEEEVAVIKRIYGDLSEYRKLMTELTAGQLVYRYLTESGYLKNLLNEVNKSAFAETKVQNIAEFFEKIKNFESVANDKSLINFYQNIELLRDAGENPATAEVDPDLDAVNILTVHKAKGLEFETVFMVNLVSGNFPGRNRRNTFEIPLKLLKEDVLEGDFHTEEERRLFYVAMTRAKKNLFLSSSEDHGGKQRKKVSPFVIEAMGGVAEVKEKHKLDAAEKLKSFTFNKDLEELIKGFYEEGKTLVLTPHQIDDYLSCPLKFKYAHIFRLPLLKSHTVMYGSAIHAAVQYYFEAKKRGKPVTIEDLYSALERSWVPEGFYTKKHEEERYQEGRRTLQKFYNREEQIGENPDKIEEPFSFVLGGGEKRVKINGRYDAVYSRDGKIEIRDFKTSDVKEQKKADKRAKDNRQISIYALSWLENNGIIPDSVSLSFVESGLVGSVPKNEKELEKTREEIELVAEGIRAMNFEAAPGWGECDRCAYKNICPFKK